MELLAHPAPRTVRGDLPLLQGIISGGQTGADVAGLRAATRLGLATGGYAPRGWKTQDGPAPELGTHYGLVETGWDYPGRTKANVRDSDATVRFAADFLSPGERCTLHAIFTFNKPVFDIGRSEGAWWTPSREALEHREYIHVEEWFRAWLVKYNVKILNVAGNSEKTSHGIGAIVESFLLRTLGA